MASDRPAPIPRPRGPYAVGIDLAEVAPIRRMLADHGERFLRRVYTARERAACAGRAERLAALFAAKEAAAKMLGSGLAYLAPGGVAPSDLEVVEAGPARLHLVLHGAALARAEALGLHDWSVSVGATRHHCVAMVVAIYD